jgi:NitT/TauT family transport system substrate-binding protein
MGAAVFYANDLGFFKDNGLNVEVQLIENGAAIAAAVASGAVDVAQANIVSLATAHDKGLPFVVLVPAALYSSTSPTTALVVAKNSPFKQAKDLDGKTIGINGVKNITQIGLMAWMDQNGGDSRTVKFLELPFAQMAAAIAAGRIDAGVVAEPNLSAAIAGDARVLAPVYTAIAPSFVIGAWFATGDWVKSHPALAKRFATAMSQAAEWANKHPDLSAKIVEKYTKVAIVPGMKRIVYPEKIDLAPMQPPIDAAAKYSVIKASFPASDLAPK